MFDHLASDPITPAMLDATLDRATPREFPDRGASPVIQVETRTHLMAGDLVKINRASVNGRGWMSTVATSKQVFERGTHAELLSDPIRAEGHIWVKLRLLDDLSGDSYFVAARYLDLVEPGGDVPLAGVHPLVDRDAPGIVFQTGDLIHTTVRMNLREAPGMQSAILRGLSRDTLGEVIAGSNQSDDAEWVPIELPGITGWVAAKHTRLFARGGKWIEIDLSTQTLIAWNDRVEDARMTISSGKPGFRTPTGTFRISSKYPARRMVATAKGEHWDIPGVPWIMVFRTGGYYIHGVYWHNDFGLPVSHGCVTLPVPSAEELYDWTPTDTPVWIHD